MFAIVCGGGKLGISLVRHLSLTGHKVVLIEENRVACDKAAGELSRVIVINGDACEPRFLDEANAAKADVLVAVTGHDEDNLVICQIAKTYFSVPRTVARVNDPRNEEALSRLGVDVTVNATSLIAQAIDKEVTLEDVSTLLKLRQGKITVLKGKITGASPLLHAALKDLPLPPKCIIASILRGEDIIVPKGDTEFSEGDEILAITTPESEAEFHRLLTGG